MIKGLLLWLSSTVASSSVQASGDQLSRTKLTRWSASNLAAGFDSIRFGSFTSVSDFRKAFPLEQLMRHRPNLFLRADSSNPIEELSQRLRISRERAIERFIAHNYYQLNDAFSRILKSTNDLVITAVLSDPFGVANENFLSPITDLLTEYLSIQSTPCLLDLLPDVFQDPTVYGQYFTPVSGYKVVPREDEGYTIVSPDPDYIDAAPGRTIVGSSMGLNRLITLYNGNDHVVIDVRKSCAVSITRPFMHRFACDLPNWLVLRNTVTNEHVVWRKNSRQPLVVPAGNWRFGISTDSSHLVFQANDGAFMITTDLHAPWMLEKLDEWHDGFVQCSRLPNTAITLDDGSIAMLTERDTSEYLWEDIAERISLRAGCSLVEMEQRLLPELLAVRAIYLFINRLRTQNYNEARVVALGICRTFQLVTKHDFILLIASVVKGYRPHLQLLLPPKLADQGRMQCLLRSISLRVRLCVISAQISIPACTNCDGLMGFQTLAE